MRIAIPTAGDSSAGKPYSRFQAPHYRVHPILLLPLLLLGHLVISYAFPEGLSPTQDLADTPSPFHRRLLSRLRARFQHTTTPSKHGFSERDGYFFYPEDAPQVAINFPRGTRLHPVIPPSNSRSSAQHLSHPPSRLHDIEGGVDKRSSASSPGEQLHPITYLIQEAETKWNAMLGRQSRTLEEAVEEYERRYKRPPPLGFDAWWEFAADNSVVLVDEC